jgi:hypothetical protein
MSSSFRFPRAANGEMTPAQIAERDLFWLIEQAGGAITVVLEENESGLPAMLRGIARTASKTALHYERQLGLPPPDNRGRKKKGGA